MTGAAATGVDVHGHGVPLAFLEEVQRARPAGVEVETSDGKYVVTFPGRKPLRPVPGRMLDFGQRLEWLDEERMRQQLIAPWLDVHGQELDAPAGQAWVRQLNDSMAESVAGSGGRLLAHSTLHVADPAGAARELERATNELGMTGCMIPTDFPGGDLAAPGYDALWEAAEALGVPVVLHPPTVGPSGCVTGMDRLGGVYGRTLDSTMCAARLLLSGVFDRFPDLRLVLVHGGGYLPYQAGRLDREHAEGRVGQGLKGIPSDYVRRFHYDTVLMTPFAIRLLLDLAGAGRVMIGSDYPFSVGAPPLLQSLEAATDDPGVRVAVTRENATTLFRTERARA